MVSDRYTVGQAIETAVQYFRDKKMRKPSHCDVRCLINDLLDQQEKGGFKVNHEYSQDRAHREVLRSLRHG